MADPSCVTLLYTANLAGELALLPRLFTLIQQERRAADGPAILLDLGDTGSVESWVCRATQGRAPFLVLDSMGYDGAIIGGPEQTPIPLSALRHLLGQMIMPVILWNRPFLLTKQGVSLTLAPGHAPLPDQGLAIRIDRSARTLPAANDAAPVLGDVAQGVLARVDLRWPDGIVQAARWISLDADTPADPTTAAVVELVESEARQYVPQHGGDG